MKKHSLKRVISALLIAVMVLAMLPAMAFAEGTTATLVTDASTLKAGDKIIIAAEAGGKTYTAGKLYGKFLLSVETSLSDISTDAAVFTLGGDSSAWTLTSAEGQLYTSAAKAVNYSGSGTGTWTISIEGSAATIASADTACGRILYNVNSPRFLNYTSATNASMLLPSIYKIEVGSEPVPETVATPTASPAAGEVAKGTAVSFACATEGATIYYKTTGEYQAYTAPVTVDADTTFTVKATKDGMTDSAEATFAYTVKADGAEKPWKDVEAKYSIYELVDAPQDGDVVLLYNPNSGNALTATDPNGNARNLSGDVETPTSGYIAIDAANVAAKAVEWKVSADTDGAFSFAQGEKKLAATKNTETSFYLSTDATGSTKWTLSDSVAANKTHYIASSDLTGTYGNVYVEWYSGVSAFTAYCTGTDRLNENAFGFAFYKLVREGVKTEEPPAPEYDTIAEALAGETGASFTVKGVVTLVDGRNIYLQDATGGICAYMATEPDDISLGDTIVATGSFKDFNGLPELDAATYEKSSGLTLKVKATTIAGLSTDDVCTYVQLTNMRIIEIYDNNGAYSTPNITLENDQGNQIQLYKAVIGKDAEGNWEYAVGDFIDVKAAVGIYKGAFQLRNTLASEITRHGEQENHIVTDLSELTDGAKVVIFNPANMQALSQNYTGYYNLGASVTAADGKLSGYGATEIWTVGKNSDGSFTFSTADGKKLSMAASFTSTPLDEVNPNWNILPAATADCFYIRNTVRGNYIEWYASKGNWSSYTKISDEALFAQQFYLVVKEEE